MRLTKSIAVLLGATLLVAGCTSAAKKKSAVSSGAPSSTSKQGSGTEKAKYKQGGTVTISNEQGQTWTCQFNPFNPSANLEAIGFVYEPLVFVDVLQQPGRDADAGDRLQVERRQEDARRSRFGRV